MRTIIAGSRTITNMSHLCDAIEDAMRLDIFVTHVISGGAKGVDALGAEYARLHKLPLTIDAKIYGPDGGDVCALFEDARPDERAPVRSDAALIAASRNALAGLIAYVRATDAMLDADDGPLPDGRTYLECRAAVVALRSALEAAR